MFFEIKCARISPLITEEALITSTVVDVYIVDEIVDEIMLFPYKKEN